MLKRIKLGRSVIFFVLGLATIVSKSYVSSCVISILGGFPCTKTDLLNFPFC